MHAGSEYSCKTGRFGKSKAAVESGQTHAVIDNTALSTTERDFGWILTCSRCAIDDERLATCGLGDTKLFVSPMIHFKVNILEKISRYGMRVLWRPPADKSLSIIQAIIDIIGTNGIRLGYSAANGPFSDSEVKLDIRTVPVHPIIRSYVGVGILLEIVFSPLSSDPADRYVGDRSTHRALAVRYGISLDDLNRQVRNTVDHLNGIGA